MNRKTPLLVVFCGTKKWVWGKTNGRNFLYVSKNISIDIELIKNPMGSVLYELQLGSSPTVDHSVLLYKKWKIEGLHNPFIKKRN